MGTAIQTILQTFNIKMVPVLKATGPRIIKFMERRAENSPNLGVLQALWQLDIRTFNNHGRTSTVYSRAFGQFFSMSFFLINPNNNF